MQVLYGTTNAAKLDSNHVFRSMDRSLSTFEGTRRFFREVLAKL